MASAFDQNWLAPLADAGSDGRMSALAKDAELVVAVVARTDIDDAKLRPTLKNLAERAHLLRVRFR